jgi:hypothetical protein
MNLKVNYNISVRMCQSFNTESKFVLSQIVNFWILRFFILIRPWQQFVRLLKTKAQSYLDKNKAKQLP